MLDFLYGFIVLYGFISMIFNIFLLLEMDSTVWAQFLNPYYVYRTRYVNWFGCAMLTLSCNVFFIAVAVCYWIYFICTVGRK